MGGDASLFTVLIITLHDILLEQRQAPHQLGDLRGQQVKISGTHTSMSPGDRGQALQYVHVHVYYMYTYTTQKG